MVSKFKCQTIGLSKCKSLSQNSWIHDSSNQDYNCTQGKVKSRGEEW